MAATSHSNLVGLKAGCNQRPLYIRATPNFRIEAEDVPKIAYMHGESSKTHLPKISNEKPTRGSISYFEVVVTTPGEMNGIVTVQLKGGSMANGAILKTYAGP